MTEKFRNHTLVGSEEANNDPQVLSVLEFFHDCVEPVLKALSVAIYARTGIKGGLFILHSEDGRVATIMSANDGGGEPDKPMNHDDADKAERVLQNALLLIQTQKLKS